MPKETKTQREKRHRERIRRRKCPICGERLSDEMLKRYEYCHKDCKIVYCDRL